jgi:formamidopyrimidine-DNA glycosylase
MPELPEVEIVRRGLEKKILSKTIDSVAVHSARTLANLPAREFVKKLKGRKILRLHRHAKYLFWILDSGDCVEIHLRMTGKFLFQDAQTKRPKHAKLSFSFQDGQNLVFEDVRTFGRFVWHPTLEKALETLKLAPDALEPFQATDLHQKLSQYSAPIKAVLLDQRKIISGLGNIYVDEALHLSRVHPLRPARTVTLKEVQILLPHMKALLERSLAAGGSTIRDYVSTEGNRGAFSQEFRVYGRDGEACPECGTQIRAIRVAQRGTHFCPRCQKLKR